MSKTLRCGGAAFVAAVLLFFPVRAVEAQQFVSDNVVVLAQEDLYTGYNDVWGFVGTNGREYVIQGTTTGTAWWDVEDPGNPQLITFIGGPGSTWRDMFVIGNYAYVGTEGGGGIQVVDISDPTAPFLATTYTATVGQSHNVFGDPARDLLFVVGGFSNGANGGLQVLDVSNPLAPVEIAQWNNQYIHDISFETITTGPNAGQSFGYAALINIDRLRILDITNPASVVTEGASWLDPTPGTHATWPLGDNVHVAIAEESGGGNLKIVDISNTSSITLVDSDAPAPAASAHNVHVEGNQLFVSWYARGTRVYDVTNPAAITEIAFLDTYQPSDGGGVGPGNWGVYPHLPSGTIASNDGLNGLFLFKVDPDAGTLNGTVTAGSGSFQAGAQVKYVNVGIDQDIAGSGAYSFSAFPDASITLEYSAFGYATETRVVSLAANGTTTTDVTLTQLPSGGLSGTLTDADTSAPIEGVEVDLLGTPLSTTTDASGFYSFPTVPADAYSVRFLRYGYAPPADQPVSVLAGSPTTLDLALEPGAIFEDFAAATGWTIQNTPIPGETATGFWEFGDPVGTTFQPGDDHTLNPEVNCAITGRTGGGAGANDVDNLRTELFSPVFNLSAMSEPHVFFYRWFGTNGGAHPWLAEVTDDGGSNWTLIDTTNNNDTFWKAVDVDLTPILASTSAVQFRFTARDSTDSPEVVEAALDDFTIYDAGDGATDVLPSGPRFVLELSQNFPNPFPRNTAIRFSLPAQQHAEISVFDVTGRRVAVLADRVMEAGSHQVTWDGQTSFGTRASSGVFFYKLSTQGEIRTRKMLRLN